MSKRPLVTRSEMRRQKKQRGAKVDSKALKSSQATKKMSDSKQVKQMKKNSVSEKATHFYRKPYEKKQAKVTSRSQTNQRSREMNTFLMKAIGIVFVLLVLVILAIIYL